MQGRSLLPRLKAVLVAKVPKPAESAPVNGKGRTAHVQWKVIEAVGWTA